MDYDRYAFTEMLDIETIAATTATICHVLPNRKHGLQFKPQLLHEHSRHHKLRLLELKLRRTRKCWYT